MSDVPSGPATQLKRYWIVPDQWDGYLAVWSRIAAIRRRAGFEIAFACIDREEGLFTWAISHPHFAEGAALYYADDERKAVSRTDYDPATGTYSTDNSRAGAQMVEDYIQRAEIRFVERTTA